jgi:hypothetical protein
MAVPAPQRHATRRISHGGVCADVDEAIAELVLQMWRHKVSTFASCEDVGDCGLGRGRLAEVSLSGADLERFRRLIGPEAGLLQIDYHGSTTDAAGLRRMRFKLADVPAFLHELKAA